MRRATRPRLLHAAAWLAAALVLGGVFMLYTRPAFMVTLAGQLWACF